MDRRKKYSFSFMLLVLCSITTYSQTPKQTTESPNTKLEAFQAKTGAVIIKGFTRIGKMRGVGGSVEVLSMEFTDAQTGRKEQGVVIELSESSRLERSNRSYIDYDEIDSLIKGIDYISKIDTSVTKQTNFEAKYSTKGDFAMTTFNDAEGIEVAISSGRIGRVDVYFKLTDLEQFNTLLTNAKNKLEPMK